MFKVKCILTALAAHSRMGNMETKVIHIEGPLTLRKVPAIRNDNCDGCFYKNMVCDEARTYRYNGALTCTVENFIWEVADAAVDEG